MSIVLTPEISPPGFSFDLCNRNNALMKRGFCTPKAKKTGTTIAGCIYKGGVILGADTRATNDNIVGDKNCLKIHYLLPNIYCCGAGTAADTDKTNDMVSSQLQLHHLNTGRLVKVCTANSILKKFLFRHQGYISAALVLGGVDVDGAHLYCIHPHGSSESQPYTTMGSGSLAAMAEFESRWRPDMEEEEAKELCADAIRAGVFNDLGSGSNIDLCIIRKDKHVAEIIRPYDVANVKGQRARSYTYKRGITAVLTKKIHPIVIEEEVVRRIEPESMDTSS